MRSVCVNFHPVLLGVFVVFCGAAGCVTGTIEGAEASDSQPLREWLLVADADLVLRDSRFPQGPGYLNPDECSSLEVRLQRDGTMCGTCRRGEEIKSEFCGGVSAGIPYFVVPSNNGGFLDLSVVDVRQAEVESMLAVGNTCVNAGSDRLGGTCMMCSDRTGVVVIDDCAALVQALEADRSTVPSGPLAPENPPPKDSMPPPSSSPPATPSNTSDCFENGARMFVGYINHELSLMGYPPYGLDVEKLERDTAETGQSTWFFNAMAVDGICDEYGDRKLKRTPGSGDYMLGSSRLRCGYLAKDSLVTACNSTAAEAMACAESAPRMDFEAGLKAAFLDWTDDGPGDEWGWENQVHGSSQASDPCNPDSGEGCAPPPPPSSPAPPGELPECSSSPLVFSVDDRPVELISVTDGILFDLQGYGRLVQTGWVEHGALLTADLNGNGRVDHGQELLGEATPLLTGGTAADGVEALAQFDDLVLGGNENGWIDVGDAIFPFLSAWVDHNRDGRSQPSELLGLDAVKVEAIDLTFQDRITVPVSAAGNHVGWQGLFYRPDGSSAEIYDVWFTYRKVVDPDA